MKRSEVQREKLSPMMQQYMEIKDKYEDCIIFFRLGDFYEMFFEDAIIASRVLELTLTGKQAGLEERVPMCGVPHHAYAGYVDELIEKGYKVAICEQLEDPKLTKGMVKRDVIQVVTKGTRIDENIDSKSNNYIANIYSFDYCYGISFADISTGEVYATLVEGEKDKVIKEIVKHGFKEVIVNDNTDREIIEVLRSNYNILVTITKEESEDRNYEYIYEDIEDIRYISTLKHLLYYILDTKKGDLHHLQRCKIIKNSEYLEFDNNTKRNLELTETLRNRERQYSLLWLLDKNKTAMGSRYLKYNIENPLTSKQAIERRYDMVEKLSTEFILRDDLTKELSNVYDLERLAGRISYGNLNAKDLLQLKSSLHSFPKIKEILEELKYDKKLETMDELYQLLDKTILEDAPFTLHEGHLIKPGYNNELDELKKISSGSKDFILELEQKEKERTGIKNLKVGFNKVFGYYIEVSKGQKHLIKEEFGYDRKQTLANCERYTTPLLKEKENIILGAEEKIINLEYKLFMDIREVVKRYIGKLQKAAKIISEIDMLQAFSIVSDQYKYVRPTLTEDKMIKMIDCRHPVVEQVMKDKYIPNDIIMDKTTDILLITGPNMAGKSTYMRQCAITVIMAQMGCFVPCKSCIIPIFDKIFTRIGASDDLVSGESTFMVEMKEANNAISEATENSLILFDELGRGTATYDGMSLAQAILEYIHDKIKAKTMFSTHYHELTSLEKDLKHLKNVHVSAIEKEGQITFLHKVKNGAVDKSYGIHVASLAHLPESLIKRADEILNIYEKKNIKKETFTQTSLFELTESEIEPKKNEIEEKIKSINPLEMTPMEALNYLYELKKEANRKE
ncbi:MAG: DNA mismatch repair protein MutS [Candidatus Faecimonas sp.]|nr:DNA mismatch repair protein MutS [Mycoplasmatota bacterium]MDY2908312.1 DNA mismatch repair protein MutS [Candidatus Faecimonas sp.]